MKNRKRKGPPPPIIISSPAFYRLVAAGVVVDGRTGGLIEGRQLREGGIPVIRQKGETFTLQRERLSGGVFVFHESILDRDYLPGKTINSDTVPPYVRTIPVHASPEDKILWLDAAQQVVPVKDGYLEAMNYLNEYANPLAFCDLEELFEPGDLYGVEELR